MSSMSPPPAQQASQGSPQPGGGPGGGTTTTKPRAANRPKKRDSSAVTGSGGGRGRKKRQTSVARSESVAAATPAASVGGGLTPGPSGSPERAFTPAPMSTRSGREGSTFSSSRRSNTTTNRGGAGGGRAGADGRTDGGESMEDDEGDMEDDEDEDGDLDLLLGDEEYDEQAKERSEAKEALRLLLDQFTPEQLERYEVYRRSGFQKGSIRKLINHVLQQSCTPNIIVAVRGLAKVFVGEIVESARQVQAEGKHEGPLAPDDIREAYRRYKGVKERKGHSRRRLFTR